MMTPIRIRAEKDAVTPKSIHPHGQEIHLHKKKENIMRSLPPSDMMSRSIMMM